MDHGLLACQTSVSLFAQRACELSFHPSKDFWNLSFIVIMCVICECGAQGSWSHAEVFNP